jgi:protein-S-isoprenylcysteine O-methyltransferase Ste14
MRRPTLRDAKREDVVFFLVPFFLDHLFSICGQKEGHQLIQRGIYRHVWHPVYPGTIMACMGMPLCLSSWYGVAIMLLVIPLFLSRMRI